VKADLMAQTELNSPATTQLPWLIAIRMVPTIAERIKDRRTTGHENAILKADGCVTTVSSPYLRSRSAALISSECDPAHNGVPFVLEFNRFKAGHWTIVHREQLGTPSPRWQTCHQY
jgi:hypothetical protein